MSQLADRPDSDDHVKMDKRMRDAHRVFPWTSVAADIRRRLSETPVALQVYVNAYKAAKYGLILRQPCGSFDWKPETTWVMPSEPGAAGRGSWAGGHDFCRPASAASRSPSPPKEPGVVDRRGQGGQVPSSTGSGGHEPIWPSERARVGAVALVGSDRVASVADRLVPWRATVGAMAIAWSRQTSTLEDVLRRVGGMTESDAVE